MAKSLQTPPAVQEAGAKMTVYPVRRLVAAFFWFVAGVAIACALALGLYWLVARPAIDRLTSVGLTMGILAAVVVIVGIVAQRWLWRGRLRFVASSWLSGYVLTGVVSLLLGFVLAQLLVGGPAAALVMVVMLFAVGMTLCLGYLQAATLAHRLEALAGAGDALAAGRLQARVEVGGQDQLAHLGAVFNAMAARVAAVDRKEYHLDRLRRNLSVWIGYDLRLPLASRGQSGRIWPWMLSQPEARMRALRIANRDINALSDLIDDLFDLGQVDLGGIQLNRRLVLMADVIEGVVAECLHLAAEKGVALAGAMTPGTPPVWIDPRQVGRALGNLVRHALNRTPQGGSVQVNAFPMRKGALVEVVDTYSGARSDEMQQIRAPCLWVRKMRAARLLATPGSGWPWRAQSWRHMAARSVLSWYPIKGCGWSSSWLRMSAGQSIGARGM